jgi:hypothetical protein
MSQDPLDVPVTFGLTRMNVLEIASRLCLGVEWGEIASDFDWCPDTLRSHYDLMVPKVLKSLTAERDTAISRRDAAIAERDRATYRRDEIWQAARRNPEGRTALDLVKILAAEGDELRAELERLKQLQTPTRSLRAVTSALLTHVAELARCEDLRHLELALDMPTRGIRIRMGDARDKTADLLRNRAVALRQILSDLRALDAGHVTCVKPSNECP